MILWVFLIKQLFHSLLLDEMIIIIPRGRVGYEMRDELAIDGVSAIALPCRGTIDRRNADIILI